MTNLINKLGIGALTLALAGSLNSCTNNGNTRNGIFRYEGEDFFEYIDTNKVIYTDLKKDGTLDGIYDCRMYPLGSTSIVDDPAKVESYAEIYRGDAKLLEEYFNRVKERYNKK